MLIYAPNAPSISVNNLITSKRVDLTITKPGSNGGSEITSYKIYINSIYNGLVSYAGTTTTYSATTLTASTEYNFYATAVNAMGEGSPSTASITTTMNAPRVSATVSGVTQINLTILPPLNNIQRNPITSYKIYINDSETSAGSATADALYNATYPANSLTAATSYSFKVTAVSIDGEGAKSAAATATTLYDSFTVSFIVQGAFTYINGNRFELLVLDDSAIYELYSANIIYDTGNDSIQFFNITLPPGTYNYTGFIRYFNIEGQSSMWDIPTINFVNASNLNIISTIIQGGNEVISDGDYIQFADNSFTLTQTTNVSIRYNNGTYPGSVLYINNLTFTPP